MCGAGSRVSRVKIRIDIRMSVPQAGRGVDAVLTDLGRLFSTIAYQIYRGKAIERDRVSSVGKLSQERRSLRCRLCTKPEAGCVVSECLRRQDGVTNSILVHSSMHTPPAG